MPDDVVAEFGGGKRVPVVVTTDGGHAESITGAKAADTRARRVAKVLGALRS